MKNKKQARSKMPKKWIALSLCAGLMGSLINPGALSFAEEVVNNFSEANSRGPSTEYAIQVPDEKPDLAVELNQELELFSGLDSSEQVIYQSEEIIPQINQAASKSLMVDVEPKDVYQLSQEQLESLLTQGYSVEELYRLDELANKLFVEPLILAERKAKEQLSWEELEQKVAAEIEATQLARLSKAYPEPYKQLKKEKLNDRERLALLVAYDTGKGTMSELLGAYKSGGEKSVVNFKPKTTIQGKSSATANKVTGSEDALDSEVLDQIRAIAKESGIPEQELIQQFKAAKEASKQMLTGKE